MTSFLHKMKSMADNSEYSILRVSQTSDWYSNSSRQQIHLLIPWFGTNSNHRHRCGLSSTLHAFVVVVFIVVTVGGQLGKAAQDFVYQPETVTSSSNNFRIVAVLDPDPRYTVRFHEFVEAVNMKIMDLSFIPDAIHMDRNPISTAKTLCLKLNKGEVYAVIVGQPYDDDLSVASVSYTCGFYNIPVIGIHSRDSAFSDKNIHSSFLRTVPPFSYQAEIWIHLLKYLNYNKVVFVHSDDTNGRASYTRLVNGIDDASIQIEANLEYESGVSDLTAELEKIFSEVSSRVILVYASTKDAEEIFAAAEQTNLTSAGFVWLVTEQALKAPNTPDGILGLQLLNASNEVAHIQDGVTILSMAIQDMHNDNKTGSSPTGCNSAGEEWETGKELVAYIKNQTLYGGETGKVGFDENGDRKFAEYNITNIIDGKHINVGNFMYSKDKDGMNLDLQIDGIVWPGNVTEKPLGIHIPTHLKVVTLIERPFLWARLAIKPGFCYQGEVPCTKWNKTTGMTDDYCCYGYCMDLLVELSLRLNFSYEVHLEKDNIYGAPKKVNGSIQRVYTGIVGELLNGDANMALGALSINPERSQVIDFTKPFKYQGITILEKMQHKSSLLASFLQPFQRELWILVMVSVHVVALALYLLDRFSPFGRYKLPNSDATEEDALNLSSAIWFAWGVLLNSGIGEGTPRSFSARVLGMVWAGFAMIVVASYTANLAAFLVLDRPDTSLSGINDARLRNPMDNFTYATVKNSAVDMYFQKQVELSNMYRTMEGRNYDTVEEAIEAVRNNLLKAFIWDSARLDFEAAEDCSLDTTGELFGRSGIGIAFPKGFFWTEFTTLAILEMHEGGVMEDLDNKWIFKPQDKENCEEPEKGPVTLGLRNMGGVFILVGAGIVGGIGLIIIEIIYKKHQTRKQKKMELARHAADKWRGAVEPFEDIWVPRDAEEKRKTLRASIESRKRLKANGMEIIACSSVDRQPNTFTDAPAATTASAHFSSFRPLPSPEIRLRVHHSPSVAVTGGGASVRPLYQQQDFTV